MIKHSLKTQIIHLLLAVAIIHQLVVSFFMHVPKPAVRQENLAFELHEYLGLAGLALVFIFWTWILIRKNETSFSSFLPWFSKEKRQAVMHDLAEHVALAKKGKIPDPSGDTPFPNAIQGLGLLAVTATAFTGGMIYFLMGKNGSVSPFGHFIMESHSFLTTFVWAYIWVHVGMAILHHFLGTPLIKSMFSFKSK
jgi:cytochrome b561